MQPLVAMNGFGTTEEEVVVANGSETDDDAAAVANGLRLKDVVVENGLEASVEDTALATVTVVVAVATVCVTVTVVGAAPTFETDDGARRGQIGWCWHRLPRRQQPCSPRAKAFR